MDDAIVILNNYIRTKIRRKLREEKLCLSKEKIFEIL